MKKPSPFLAAALSGALFVSFSAAAQAAPRIKKTRRKPAAVITTAATAPTAPVLSAELKALLAQAPSAKDYPNAAKATLLDVADIQVRPDGSARTVTRQLIKVFNERGRDEAEVRIPYNHAFERVTITRARTIKSNGQILSVKPSDVRDHAVDEGEDSYSDARIKSFSLPAVDDGAVLEYEYVTDQKAPLMPGQFWTRWWFQTGSDPVVESRLTVTMPKGLAVKEALKNTDLKPVTKESADGSKITRVWRSRGVPSIEWEPMMPGAERIAPHLALSTVGTWQDIAAWYWTLAKDRANPDAAIKAQTAALIKGKTTPEEKAKAIFYHVEEKTRYVALEYGIGGYQPRRAADVSRNQYGDCKDMTTLLVAMLKEAGITAHPVLLRAGSTAKVSDELPSPHAFNHAICLAEINGKKFWLDATAQLASWGVVPGGDRGAQAFVIRDGVGSWEVIPHAAPEENRLEQTAKLTLAADGSATGTVRVQGTGDADMGLRGALFFTRPDKVKEMVERMAQGIGANAKVTKYTVSDFRNKDLPVTITYDVTLPSWAQKSGSMLLFKARAEQSAGSGSSPFLQETREHPIFQDSSGVLESTVEIAIPAGYSPLSMPEPLEVKSDLGIFRRTVTNKDNALTIAVRAENHRADIPAARYSEVRKYYDDMVKVADEPIILKKG